MNANLLGGGTVLSVRGELAVARWFHRKWLLIFALAALGAGGCNKPQIQTPPAPKPPEVFVDLPITGEITDYEDFTGRTVAIKTIDIRASVTGYLQKINFKEKEGGDVEKDFVLFEIDPRPYQASLTQVEGQLAHDTAVLNGAKIDLDRYQQAFARNAIAKQELGRYL